MTYEPNLNCKRSSSPCKNVGRPQRLESTKARRDTIARRTRSISRNFEMKINQLVKVKVLIRPAKTDYLMNGKIGVITRVSKARVEVRFKDDTFIQFRPEQIEIVDTHHCETVPYSRYRKRIIDEKDTLDRVILGNELKAFVGIGWVTEDWVTERLLGMYPRVVDDAEHELIVTGRMYGI